MPTDSVNLLQNVFLIYFYKTYRPGLFTDKEIRKRRNKNAGKDNKRDVLPKIDLSTAKKQMTA